MKIKFIMLALLMNHAHSRCAMNPANFDSRSYGFFIQQLAPITLCVSTLLITPLVAISMYSPCRKSKKPRIIVIPRKINVMPIDASANNKRNNNHILDAMIQARKAEQEELAAMRQAKDNAVIARTVSPKSPRAGKGRKKK